MRAKCEQRFFDDIAIIRESIAHVANLCSTAKVARGSRRALHYDVCFRTGAEKEKLVCAHGQRPAHALRYRDRDTVGKGILRWSRSSVRSTYAMALTLAVAMEFYRLRVSAHRMAMGEMCASSEKNTKCVRVLSLSIHLACESRGWSALSLLDFPHLGGGNTLYENTSDSQCRYSNYLRGMRHCKTRQQNVRAERKITLKCEKRTSDSVLSFFYLTSACLPLSSLKLLWFVEAVSTRVRSVGWWWWIAFTRCNQRTQTHSFNVLAEI